MALQKQIVLDNGIVTNYHRIVSINKITNNSTIVEVASYISKDERQKEIEYYKSKEEDKSMNVFINTTYMNVDYEENKNIQDLYNYIKTTEIFKDAEDI